MKAIKILIVMFTVAMTAFVMSCKKTTAPAVPKTFLNIPVKEVIFSSGTGTKAIAVDSNKEFTVQSSESWCPASVSESQTGIKVTVTANETVGEERIANITVVCDDITDNITVRQSAIVPSLYVKETTGIVINQKDVDAAFDFTLEITANIPVAFEFPEWIREKDGNTPVIGKKIYSFQAVAVPKGVNSRTGNLVVKSANASINKSISIIVTQNVFIPKFTIPIFPDTQRYFREAATYGILNSQVSWIIAKADSMRTPIVLHVGDVVDWDSDSQWLAATPAMYRLNNANIPYAITVGNHDTYWSMIHNIPDENKNAALRNTGKFNSYFPVSRFSLQKGRFENNKSDNAYYTFEAGGLKWLVVTLEFCAREVAAQWMDQTLKSFPDHNAIILTHYHLTPSGNIENIADPVGDMIVSDIFNKYIKPNKNVLMILSGHVCNSAKRTDVGSNGNVIYQILQDYQCDDNDYIRLLEIDVHNKTINAKMFSPSQKINLNDYSNFTFTGVSFIEVN